ncbi:Short-chain dehydrogenase/reductase SDR [Penicillium expansum]|nr:Short-chain dehydrogenase/reductase SDR [Penicillium expansum]
MNVPEAPVFPLLEGKVAIVTGAAQGMGKATASVFLRAGAKVVIADVKAEQGAKVADELSTLGEVRFVETDISKSEDVQNLIKQTVSAFGRLDVAINNAAMSPDQTPLIDFDESYWRRLMDVSLTGTALCCKYQMQQMEKQGSRGSIVNIASINAYSPQPNMPAYTAAKHALLGLTKHAATEGGPKGIRVNAIAPGAIFSEMSVAALEIMGTTHDEFAPKVSSLNRFGQAHEVAQGADQELLAFDIDNGIKRTGQNDLDILESLEQTTRDAYNTCVQKRWKITIPGKGKKIIIRDLLSKVVHWIELFKSVGDQAVSKFDFVVQGAERIAKMTARYKMIGKIYIQKESAATKQLEQAVVGVYGSILKYLVEAKRYFEHKTGVRILKSGLLGQDDFQGLLDKMEADERLVDRCTSLVQSEKMKSFPSLRYTLSRMEQPISQVFFHFNKVEDHLNSIQRREVLNWLSSQPYLDHHTTIKSRVLDGTCQWVLQHTSFTKWQGESTNSLLWLYGAQGAGKSCLASTVIEDGMKVSSQIEDFAHAYFYCSRNTAEPQRANAQSILGCIARQLSSPSSNQPLAPATISLHSKIHLADGSTRAPNLVESRDLIVELTEAHPRTTIVIDALDESPREERADLVEALEYIIDNSTSLVKIFVTSREEGDLRLSIQAHSGVQVTWVENGSDIEKFVNFETNRLVAKNQLLAYIRVKTTKEDLKTLIKEDTISKANGMFRWAQLQLQSLRWIRTEKDIRLAMSKIPRLLSELYEDLYRTALESTEETDRALFRNTLRWMLCTTRVFGWEDFSQAITSFVDIEIDEIDEDFILDLLGNFVVSQTTQEGSRTFRFAHLSVREFLETKPEYSIKSSNTFGAEVCLLKLLGASGSPNAQKFLGGLGLSDKDTVTLSEIGPYRKGIHDYSLQYWNEHCVRAGKVNRSDEELLLFHLLRYFLFDNSDLNCPLKGWVHALQRRKMGTYLKWYLLDLLRNYHQSRDRAFLLSCVFGFHELLRIDHYHELHDDLKEACMLAAAKHRQYDILIYLTQETKSRLVQKRVLKAIVRNNDVEPLEWFLTVSNPDLITGSVIIDATWADTKILELLLDRNKNIHITTEFIEENARSYTVIEALLSRAPDVVINSAILNNSIADIPIERLRELLGRNDGLIITSDNVAYAACFAGYEYPMRAKIDFLLERAGESKGTEENMMRVIGMCGNPYVIQSLLDHGWPVTERVMELAAIHSWVELFERLVRAGGPITSQAIVNGTVNRCDGARMVKLLVSLMDRPLDDDLWVQMMVLYAQSLSSEKTIHALLGIKPGVKVSEEVLIALTRTSMNGNIILDAILDDDREMQITDAVIVNALRNLDYGNTIAKLLNRQGSTNISSEMLLGAAQNPRFANMMTKLLLQQTATIEKPSSMVIDAVIGNQISGCETLQMLERHFGRFNLSEEHVKTAAKSGNHVMLLLVLVRCSITEATTPVLLAAASNGSLEVMEQVLKLDNAVVTKEILIAASNNYHCRIEMLGLLWNFAPHIKVSPEMFLNAWDYTGAEFLFFRVEDSKLCQDILNAVLTAKRSPVDWISEHLLDLILESKFEIQVTDELVMGALKAGQGWLLGAFFDHGIDIELSQDMVNKAVELEDHQALEVLVKHGNSLELNLHHARSILDYDSPWDSGKGED